VFKYSKGYNYLTQVVKTPKVLEVTKWMEEKQKH
jgi:hypothetical protein